MRDEERELLRRIVKYAREDRATTHRATRLERVLAETERFLARASEPEHAARERLAECQRENARLRGVIEKAHHSLRWELDLAEAKEPTT